MAHDYSSEATQRCERVLGTLMRGIGQPWRHKICLVGGLVPLYLVPGSDYAQPEHVGSTDVDVALRLVVGYLGEHNQEGWWDCDFLNPTGVRLLESTFPRTARAAALRSTTEAACATHDRALGRIGTYHLFRLPPALEDRLEEQLELLGWVEVMKVIESKDTALSALRRMAETSLKAPEGPIQVGVESRISTPSALREMAAHYDSAFRGGIRTFPYFTRETSGR